MSVIRIQCQLRARPSSRVQKADNKKPPCDCTAAWQWVSRGTTSRFTRSCCGYHTTSGCANAFTEQLAPSILHGSRNGGLMNVHADILLLTHKGAPFR